MSVHLLVTHCLSGARKVGRQLGEAEQFRRLADQRVALGKDPDDVGLRRAGSRWSRSGGFVDQTLDQCSQGAARYAAGATLSVALASSPFQRTFDISWRTTRRSSPRATT